MRVLLHAACYGPKVEIQMPTTYTPLRYPGGKTKYSGLLEDLLRANDLVGCRFVEVFAGGAGAAVKLLLNDVVGSVWLNDLDVAVYSFWTAVRDYPEDLIRLVEGADVNIRTWHTQKSIYENREDNEVVSLAFATLFLNRCNHAGILGARPIGGLSQKGRYKIDARFNRKTLVRKIESIAERASDITVTNLEGVELIEQLGAEPPPVRTFVYLDPPYVQKGPGLYLNHLSSDDHGVLCDVILGLSVPWLLSYDDHKVIRDLYRQNQLSVGLRSLRHTIAGNRGASELLISPLNLKDHCNSVCS